MQILNLKTFKYNELPEEVKVKLRSEYEVDDDWYEEFKQQWIDKIQNFGFCNVVLDFSGFCNQGDGASFIGNVSLMDYIKYKINNQNHADDTYKMILTALIDGTIELTENIIKRDKFTRYLHENTVSLYLDYVECDGFDYDSVIFNELFVQLSLEIENHIKTLSRAFYYKLEELFDSITTNEIIDGYYENQNNNYFIDGNLIKDEYIALPNIEQESKIIPERDTFNHEA